MNPKRSLTLMALLLGALLVCCLQSCAPGSAPSKGGKSCLDCHEEYRTLFAEGVVHQPVKSGDCAGCHRKHGIIGGAYLKVEGATLCYTCHQPLALELAAKTQLHGPIKEGNCAACHQHHNAPEAQLLNKPAGQLCFDCHAQADFQRKFVHPPLAEGCQTCHETHGSTVERLLIKEEGQLCKDCHKVGSGPFVAAHGNYPVTGNCSSCHSVHSADNAKLLKVFTHQPVAAGECQGCHAAPDAAQPFAIADKSAQLCFSCHSEHQQRFTGAKVHAPVADGDCFACHDPHSSDFVGISKQNPQTLCFECHSFKFFGNEPELQHPGSVHTPAGAGDCLSCHGPHLPAAGESVLLRKSANKLCLDCHDEQAERKRVNHDPAQEGQCLTCHLPHESSYDGVLVKPQRALCAECHTVVGEDLGQPNLHRPFVAGNCAACHAPHGGQNKTLLLATGAESCGQCHGVIEIEREQSNRHEPFTEGRCELCHQSHGSRLPFLLSQDASVLCVSCHADRQPPEGTPGGHQNCSVCHHAHGNDESSFLLKSQPDLCLGCHNVDQYWNNGVGHSPAVDGDCAACHNIHAPQLSVAKRADASVCADCHEVDGKTLAGTHNGISPGEKSCMGCHDPHGGPDASLTLPVKHAPFAEGDCASCHKGDR